MYIIMDTQNQVIEKKVAMADFKTRKSPEGQKKALSLLCSMSLVQLFVQNLHECFPGIVSRYFLIL
jgi:hypothetical protein